jgi:hypothetical protein
MTIAGPQRERADGRRRKLNRLNVHLFLTKIASLFQHRDRPRVEAAAGQEFLPNDLPTPPIDGRTRTGTVLEGH